jgi:hypothetical protein
VQAMTFGAVIREIRSRADRPVRARLGLPCRRPDYRPERRLRARSSDLPSLLRVMQFSEAARGPSLGRPGCDQSAGGRLARRPKYRSPLLYADNKRAVCGTSGRIEAHARSQAHRRT